MTRRASDPFCTGSYPPYRDDMGGSVLWPGQQAGLTRAVCVVAVRAAVLERTVSDVMTSIEALISPRDPPVPTPGHPNCSPLRSPSTTSRPQAAAPSSSGSSGFDSPDASPGLPTRLPVVGVDGSLTRLRIRF